MDHTIKINYKKKLVTRLITLDIILILKKILLYKVIFIINKIYKLIFNLHLISYQYFSY